MNFADEKTEVAFLKYQNKKRESIIYNAPFIKRSKTSYEIIRPILIGVLKVQRFINGQKISFINKPQKIKSNVPIIFVISHIGKWDFEIINECIKNSFVVLVSDFKNMYHKIGGYFMAANGVIFVNERSREDKRNTKETAKRLLEMGYNLMIFPEGTWNLSENEIIRDIHYGTVDLAIKTGDLLYPIAIEQYDKEFVINAGALTDVSKMYKEVTNIMLRDILASLKFEIWEKKGVFNRSMIPDNYWHKFIENRMKEWPGYSMEEQVINTYTPKEKLEQRQVEMDLNKLRNKILF